MGNKRKKVMKKRATFEKFKEKMLKDPARKAEYEKLRPEFEQLEKEIEARKPNKHIGSSFDDYLKENLTEEEIMEIDKEAHIKLEKIKNNQRSVLTVRISREMHEKLRDLVFYMNNATLNDIVEDAIKDLLDHFEDIPKRIHNLKTGTKIK